VWKQEIIDGQPPRSESMTGLAGWQVAELVVGVHALLGGWQRLSLTFNLPGSSM
jgi:hypothetical protein